MKENNDSFRYERLSPDETSRRISVLFNMLNDFISTGYAKQNVKISKQAVFNIVADVDTELMKIKTFHGMYASECKETSLLCYYFLKRKPIIYESAEGEDTINEKFCVYLILSRLNVKARDKIVTKDYIEYLVYMFYRGELSKDAIYMLAMTIEMMRSIGD